MICLGDAGKLSKIIQSERVNILREFHRLVAAICLPG